MAIVEVRETGKDRGSSLDQEFTQQISRSFIVISDVRDEVFGLVQTAIDPNDPTEYIPRIGELYGDPNTVDAYVVSVRPRQREDCPEIWDVDVEYSSTGDPQTVDPLQRPAEIEWDHDPEEVAVETATLVAISQGANFANGHASVGKTFVPINTAGDPFEPPLMRDKANARCTITFNVERFPLAINRQYAYTVNADAAWGFPPGEIRMLAIKGTRFREQGAYFFRITVVLEFRKDGWDRKVLNAGFHAWKDGHIVGILDDFGTQVSSPRLLTEDGEEMKTPQGQPPNPVYLHYRIYPRESFQALKAALGLPEHLDR